MTEDSDNFEKMVSRIHELLEDDNSTVTWNERIPDPDNPNQGRQVDVLVKKNGTTNLIECRLHKKTQDVKWVEELIGRRISLEANSVIAVSASGFTSGAIKKANRHGVILRDLNTLTDKEITSWSRFVDVSVFFYRYENFKLSLHLDTDDLSSINTDQIQKELRNYIGFRTLFKAQLDLIDEKKLIVEENRSKNVKFEVKFGIEGFELCSHVVKLIESTGVAYLEEVKLSVPEVWAFGDPDLDSINRNVYIQNYNLGETKLIHNDEHISLTLDLSKLVMPPYWQFRFMNVSSEFENYLDLLEIVNPENINMVVDRVNLSIASAQG